MNLAQLIDPERALAQVDEKRSSAGVPSVRVHAAAPAQDARRAPAKLNHPHRPTAGDGTSLLVLKALATSPAPLHSKQLAALLGIDPSKASRALVHLHHSQLVVRTGDKRPYPYRATAKGREKCA